MIASLEGLGFDESLQVQLEVGGDGAVHTGAIKGVFTEGDRIVVSAERVEGS